MPPGDAPHSRSSQQHEDKKSQEGRGAKPFPSELEHTIQFLRRDTPIHYPLPADDFVDQAPSCVRDVVILGEGSPVVSIPYDQLSLPEEYEEVLDTLMVLDTGMVRLLWEQVGKEWFRRTRQAAVEDGASKEWPVMQFGQHLFMLSNAYWEGVLNDEPLTSEARAAIAPLVAPWWGVVPGNSALLIRELAKGASNWVNRTRIEEVCRSRGIGAVVIRLSGALWGITILSSQGYNKVVALHGTTLLQDPTIRDAAQVAWKLVGQARAALLPHRTRVPTLHATLDELYHLLPTLSVYDLEWGGRGGRHPQNPFSQYRRSLADWGVYHTTVLSGLTGAVDELRRVSGTSERRSTSMTTLNLRSFLNRHPDVMDRFVQWCHTLAGAQRALKSWCVQREVACKRLTVSGLHRTTAHSLFALYRSTKR